MQNFFVLPSNQELDDEKLAYFINKHRALVPQYQLLSDMYEGKHNILRLAPKEKYKPDNRIVVNYAKYLVDTFNGYFIGTPVRVRHENTSIGEYLELLDAYNDQDDNNAELSKICSIFGHGYELVFNDETANVGITYIDPREAFVIYDDSIRQKPKYAVRYFINDDNLIEGTYSDDYSIVYFVQDKDGYRVTDIVEHYFGGVPMIEYVENEERLGVFENVITIIDAINKAISEKANDVDYFSDAYLKVLGAVLEDEELHKLRDTRIINIANDDINNLVVEFLSKPEADTTQENLLNRLTDMVFQISMVANISDESFGNASGVSLRYKLQSMDNLAKTKERKFMSGMLRRYRLIANYPLSKIGKDDWLKLKFSFTRNIPANLLEESQIAGNLAGIVSEETMVSVLSIVDNPKKEIEEKNKGEGHPSRTGGGIDVEVDGQVLARTSEENMG